MTSNNPNTNGSKNNCLISNNKGINNNCQISDNSAVVNSVPQINKNTISNCRVSITSGYASNNVKITSNIDTQINKSINNNCQIFENSSVVTSVSLSSKISISNFQTTSISINSTSSNINNNSINNTSFNINTDSQSSNCNKTSADKGLIETITKTILENKTQSSSEITITKYIIQDKISTKDKKLASKTKIKNQEKFRRRKEDGDFNLEEKPRRYKDFNEYSTDREKLRDLNVDKIPREYGDSNADKIRRDKNGYLIDQDRSSNSFNREPIRTGSSKYNSPRLNTYLFNKETSQDRNEANSHSPIYNSKRPDSYLFNEDPLMPRNGYLTDNERLNNRQTSTEPETTILKRESYPEGEDLNLRTRPESSKIKRLTLFKKTGTGDRTIKLDMDEIRQRNLKSMILDQLESQNTRKSIDSYKGEIINNDFDLGNLNKLTRDSDFTKLSTRNPDSSSFSNSDRSTRNSDLNPVQNIPSTHNSQNLENLISKFKELADSILMKNSSTSHSQVPASQVPVSVVSTRTVFIVSSVQSTRSKSASCIPQYKELEKLEKNFKEESLKNRILMERVLEKLDKSTPVETHKSESINSDIPLYPNGIINEILENLPEEPVGDEKKPQTVIFPRVRQKC